MSSQDMRDTFEQIGQMHSAMARVNLPKIIAEVVPKPLGGEEVHYHFHGPIIINVGHNAECNLGDSAVWAKEKTESSRFRRY